CVLKGDRAEALKIYAACCDALKRDLGVAPDFKTEELYRDILTDRPLQPSSGPEATRAADRPSIAVLPFSNPAGMPISDTSATGSPKTSSSVSGAFVRCSSSIAIPRWRHRSRAPMSAKLVGGLVSPTSRKVACSVWASDCDLPYGSSMPAAGRR